MISRSRARSPHSIDDDQFFAHIVGRCDTRGFPGSSFSRGRRRRWRCHAALAQGSVMASQHYATRRFLARHAQPIDSEIVGHWPGQSLLAAHTSSPHQLVRTSPSPTSACAFHQAKERRYCRREATPKMSVAECPAWDSSPMSATRMRHIADGVDFSRRKQGTAHFSHAHSHYFCQHFGSIHTNFDESIFSFLSRRVARSLFSPSRREVQKRCSRRANLLA